MNYEKLENHLVKWLKDYAINAKCDGYIIGCSGGIDSSVVSTLCAKTGLKLLVYSLNIHKKHNEASRAQFHMNWLVSNFDNVKKFDFDLSNTYDTMVKDLETSSDLNSVDLETRGLILANLRSRLRMVALYAVAPQERLLVCGTGNKVEDFGIGFYTKWGDGGVDVSVIGDLYKTDVWRLGEFMGIDRSIIEAKPTDGLWEDGRSDEDQIGASYAELEWAMKFVERYGFDFNEIAFKANEPKNDITDRQKEVLSIYKHRHFSNKHKMDPIPVCKIPNDVYYDR